MNAERQKRRQERHRRFLWCLTFSTMLLPTWSCIVYLTVRINNQAEDDPTDDLLALCPFMVLSLVKTYRCVIGHWYYNDMDYMQKRRHWFVCLCFRLIFVFAVLGFTYSMPHLTPSISAFWISVTVTHIPECRKFSSWMNYWTSSELCLQPNVDYSHGPNCKCHVIQGMFTILVSIPHFATLFATFIAFHPDKAINIPSMIIFIFLSAIVTRYKRKRVTLYGLQ
ncbi:hypothetical protein DdX_17412 [Ditylenchus destructor]|uniref:Uncharacterized protein n=1 Tax=Ditylenchus destructor TaxID=166010 RepID=A0AAD4MNN1_9BILA|nr:hypothetical protein DdX_17412 [Ditylenchus destructor]